MRGALWFGAVVCWLTALIVGVLPSSAGAQVVGGSGMQFSFGQVVVLFAAGLAWGDLRAQVKSLRDEFERHIDEEG